MEPEVIYVDVDGTIDLHGMANAPLVSWLAIKKAEGARLFLWSARGDQHAIDVAKRHGCYDLFNAILPKPNAIIDDRGWSWARFVPIIFRYG